MNRRELIKSAFAGIAAFFVPASALSKEPEVGQTDGVRWIETENCRIAFGKNSRRSGDKFSGYDDVGFPNPDGKSMEK